MMDRRDPDYVPVYQCDVCGEVLHVGDRYKELQDGTIECLECLLEELETVEAEPSAKNIRAHLY